MNESHRAVNATDETQSGQVPDRLPGRVESHALESVISTHSEFISGIDSLAIRETPSDHVRVARRARPLGKRQLDIIADGLTDRDLAILRSLKQHRFLTTSQIERWHFTDHATPVTASRISRRVLARLQSLELLEHLARRLGGIRAGSSSYVWHLTQAGERLLNTRRERTPGRRIREPSVAFLEHELGIAETHLQLVEASRTPALDLIDVTTEPSCWRTFVGAGGQVITLKPDLFAVTASGEDEYLWFAEYDRGFESLQTIEKKARVYEAYRNSGREQQRSGVFPRVLWIVPTTDRARKIEKALGGSALVSTALHQVITPDRLIEAVTESASGTGDAQ
jgi:hypothetical protein